MTTRHALYVLLVVVSVAAAVLSFAALRDLALLCGFSTRLAWLLPVVVDAGAAGGSLVWLGRHGDARAQRFATWLALVLLASSVAANAVSHGLEAYGMQPAWWVVVLVSAVAPAVLGAVVHLAVLVGRQPASGHLDDGAADLEHRAAIGAAIDHAAVEAVAEAWQIDDDPQVTTVAELLPADSPEGGEGVAPYGFEGTTETKEGWEAYAAHLIALGFGRKRLARELDLSEHEARALLVAHRARLEGQEATG